MDYQSWLKEFGSELSDQWKGIRVGDLDSLYVQSLYHKGMAPLDAAKQKPSLKKPEEAGIPAGPGRFTWLYGAGTLAAIVIVTALWHGRTSPRHAIPSTPQTASVTGSQTADADPDPAPKVGAYGNASAQEPQGMHLRFHVAPASARRMPVSVSAVGGTGDGGYSSEAAATAEEQAAEQSPGAAGTQSAARTASTTSGGSADTFTPAIQQFQVTVQGQGNDGLSGQLSWQVINSDQVQISLMGVPLDGTNTSQGSIPFSSALPGDTFTLRAWRGGRMVEQTASVQAPAGGN